MRNRRAKLAVAVVSAVGALVLAACSGGSSKGDHEVTLFGGQPISVKNLKTNWFTGYVQKKFGLKFKFSLVPGSDLTSKQSLLLGSGNYPEVLWGTTLSPTDVLKYGKQGVFVPLNDMLKKYAPNAWKAIQTVPGYKQDVTAPDGKIYALPFFNYCPHCLFTDKLYINIKYLKQFHLAAPKTTADFEHVLEVFKQHGLTPLTGASERQGGYGSDPTVELMNAFLPFNGPEAGPTGYVNVTDGKVSFAPADPRWRKGLAYMHDLYSKGLFSNTIFTQDQNALVRLVSNGKVGVFSNGGPNTAINNYGQPGSNYLDWFALPLLKGPDGAQFGAFQAGQGAGFSQFTFAMTNKASKDDSIKIMKLINYLYTPKGTQTLNFGAEGKYWKAADKGQKGLVPKQALFQNTTKTTSFYSGNSIQNDGWNQWGPIYGSEVLRNLQVGEPPFSSDGDQTLIQLDTELFYLGHQAKQVYPPVVWVQPSEVQQFGTEQTNLNNFVEQWKAEFITGAKSVDKDWDSYLKGLDKLGLKNYLQTLQKDMGKPFDTTAASYQPNQAEIKYLLSMGSVPETTKQYLIQEGIPASYFAK